MWCGVVILPGCTQYSSNVLRLTVTSAYLRKFTNSSGKEMKSALILWTLRCHQLKDIIMNLQERKELLGFITLRRDYMTHLDFRVVKLWNVCALESVNIREIDIWIVKNIYRLKCNHIPNTRIPVHLLQMRTGSMKISTEATKGRSVHMDMGLMTSNPPHRHSNSRQVEPDSSLPAKWTIGKEFARNQSYGY